MLYIIYGEDNFSIRELLSKIKEDCGGTELGEVSTTSLEGKKVTFNELIAACNTISFLAPKRLVIVEGLLSRFETKEKRLRSQAQSQELKDWSNLVEEVANMPESTVLVLVGGKLSKTNPLLKKIAQVAEVRECVPLKGTILQKWIRSRVASNGCDISPSALRFLIDLIGSNLWILSNEIDKLCLYAGERRIEQDDVNLLVSYARESNIFAMVDAIVERRLEVASRLTHQLLDEGSAPPYILYMITRQFRLLVQAKGLLAQGLSVSVIGSKIGLTSEFVLGKTIEQARRYSLNGLSDTYRRLLETDLSIKTGAMDGELAIDLLITELCGS